MAVATAERTRGESGIRVPVLPQIGEVIVDKERFNVLTFVDPSDLRSFAVYQAPGQVPPRVTRDLTEPGNFVVHLGGGEIQLRSTTPNVRVRAERTVRGVELTHPGT